MNIICLEEKVTHTNENGGVEVRYNDVGFFSDIAIARYSIHWKMACQSFAGDDHLNRKYQKFTKVDVETGDIKDVSLIEKEIIGDKISNIIRNGVAKIYCLEIVDDVDEQGYINYFNGTYKDPYMIHKTYYTDVNDTLATEYWKYFIERSKRFKYEFKSHFARHYIDLINKRSVRIYPVIVRIKKQK